MALQVQASLYVFSLRPPEISVKAECDISLRLDPEGPLPLWQQDNSTFCEVLCALQVLVFEIRKRSAYPDPEKQKIFKISFLSFEIFPKFQQILVPQLAQSS